MEFGWNPWALPGLVACAYAWLMAGLVEFSNPGRPQNRWLALLLFIEGAYLGALAVSVLATSATTARAAFATAFCISAPFAAVYVLFLRTLESPIVRGLRRRSVSMLLGAAAATVTLAVLVHSERFVTGALPGGPPWSPWIETRGPWATYIPAVTLAVYVFALLVAVTAWRGARPGSVARQRAKAYASAFLLYDAWYVGAIAVFIFAPATFDRLLLLFAVVTPLVVMAWVTLIGYGILRTQLFDIDVRVKGGLTRSTVAAAFVAVFFVVSTFAQEWLSESLGLAAGAVAAGLLLFAIAPLQRAAERVADAAMPRVQATSEYAAFRKLEVYRAAVESALEEGVFDERERAVLARLRAKLGIAARDAEAVERDVRERVAAV